MYHEYREKGLITDEDWDKYNAMNLVIESKKSRPWHSSINS